MSAIADPSKSRKSTKHRRGAALAIMLFVLSVVMVLGLAISMRSIGAAQIVRFQSYQTKAFWAAESGVQKTYWELNHNDCKGMRNRATSQRCESCSNCGSGTRFLAGTVEDTEYDVELDMTRLSAVSSGYYPTKESAQAARRVLFLFGGEAAFGQAIMSKGAVSLDKDATVDSFDSRQGAYGGANVGKNGNVVTKGNAKSDVKMSDKAKVKGEVTSQADAKVAGVSVPRALSAAPDRGVLAVPTDETKTLVGGDYKFESLSMRQNSELMVDGAVQMYLTSTTEPFAAEENARIVIPSGASLRIYVDGAFTFSNNVTLDNQAKRASSFTIFSSYAGSGGVSISGKEPFYGAVYSPDTDVKLGNNSSVYGAVVGKSVSVGEKAAVHYDLDLRDTAVPSSLGSIRDWHEI